MKTSKGKYVHELVMPIRWSDMDAFSHVNTCVYFTYFEQTRISWFMSLAPHYNNFESGPVVLNTSCTFLKSIVFPEIITVKLYVGPPGQTSFDTFYEVKSQTNSDTVYAEGSAKMVWVDLKSSRSTPLPDELRAALLQS